MIGVLRDGHAHGKRRVCRPPGITAGGAGAVTTAPLHAHRYFWRAWCSTWYVAFTVVMRSAVSHCPTSSVSVPPQAGHPR